MSPFFFNFNLIYDNARKTIHTTTKYKLLNISYLAVAVAKREPNVKSIHHTYIRSDLKRVYNL